MNKIFSINDFNSNVLPALEENYNVVYPVLQNATYRSLVNYATDLKSPIQRWYRYKEGYSIKLVNKLFKEYGVKSDDIVLDPFCGSGSTLIQAKINGISSIGFEINPFSAFLAKTKTQNYSEKDFKYFSQIAKNLLSIKSYGNNQRKPKLSTIDKLFDSETLNYLLNLKFLIKKINNQKVKELFFLIWLSILEESSNYRKAGNGLKIRRGRTLPTRNIDFVKLLFRSRLRQVKADLPYAIEISNKIVEPKIYEHTSLEMEKYIPNRSIKGVIFSPPYANCFDYTEIYKVELWLGDFVEEYGELKKLRERAVRSHLNGYNGKDGEDKINSVKELEIVVETLKRAELWDKRIPKMIKSYFIDMFCAIDKIYNSLKLGGFCTIIVSNSAYGGVIVPTDLLLMKYAELIGFKPLKIDVARFIITSSQQYKKTEKHKKYLRESIIHLQK